MTLDEAYQYFGSANKASKALGISRSTFSLWITKGYIPFFQQKRIEAFTKGKLIAKKIDSIGLSEKEGDYIATVYFPIFRYYDASYGMCEVESLYFRKGKCPKITYKIPGNNREKFSSFILKNLMQGTHLKDSKGNILYEGDICLLKGGKKLIFKNIDMLETFKKLDKFKITGNIFEK